jgi:7,8-dihydro-6-hydroxymethylpterin-pyrophosphokinase
MSERTLTEAYVALGSNLGDRERHLRGAVAALAEAPGVQLVPHRPSTRARPHAHPARSSRRS